MRSVCFLGEQHMAWRRLLITEVLKGVLTWSSETKILYHVRFSAFFSFLGALRLIFSLVCHPRYSLFSGISCSLLLRLRLLLSRSLVVSNSGIRKKEMNDKGGKINLCFSSFSFLSTSEEEEKVKKEDMITSSSSMCSEHH